MLLFVLFALVFADNSQYCAENSYYADSDRCVKCIDNTEDTIYVLNTNYQCVIQQEVENCKTMKGEYCVECKVGFYLQNEQCVSCDNVLENCGKCRFDRCLQCEAPFSLFEKDGVQECVNCAWPENDEKCGRCELGKYFDTELLTCQNCRENCTRCTNATDCYLCADGLALKNIKNAHLGPEENPCVALDHCVKHYGSHCELCEEEYYVNDGFCAPCGGNCSLCINEPVENSTDANLRKCVQCNDNYILNEHGLCIRIDHCAISNPVLGCVECEVGYYLDTTGDYTCKKCNPECFSCYTADYCFTCAEDYYFSDINGGKCVHKDDQYCEMTDQYGCIHCIFDVPYETDVEGKPQWKNLNEEEIKAAIVLEAKQKSVSGYDEGSENITASSIGFYLAYEYSEIEGKRVVDKECSMCNPACRICEHNRDWCTACNAGYEMKRNETATSEYKRHFGLPEDSNFAIFNCIKMSDTCLETEMGYCTKCDDKHFLSGISCEHCDVTCDTCVENHYCITCNNTVDINEDAMYFRPPFMKEIEAEERGLCFTVSNDTVREEYHLNHCAKIGVEGCIGCEKGYYKNEHFGGCKKCPERCTNCQVLERCLNMEKDLEAFSTGTLPDECFECTECRENDQFLREVVDKKTQEVTHVCVECSEIENCAVCFTGGCKECAEDYTLSGDYQECTRVNIEVVVPLTCVGLLIIIAIIILIVALIWRKKKKELKEREKEIKPFKVSNEIEMALLSADNENFPLKTDTWTLDFGLKTEKAKIDQEYFQTVVISNPTNTQYFFEILAGASHRYDFSAEPMRFTLKPGFAIEIKFKIKMLCTALVKDEIGIVAMNMDEDVKETAKLTIIIESDLSMKLDHSELQLQLPAIGEGAFGTVFLGTYRGQKVAVKKMKARNMTEEQEKEFKHEVNMLTQYRHPCVVNLVGAVYTEGEVSIVTEFADYGSLSKLFVKEEISYDLKIKLMEDASVGLAFLHKNQVIHRDVKGENVLVYTMNVHAPVCGKLTDFGTCRNISERALAQKELSQGIGTPTYMAPECLGNAAYSYSADVYSFGIVLYETYVEKGAYDDDERFVQPWMIPQFVIEGKRLEMPEDIPSDYWGLIESCWQHDAEDRPSFAQIYATLAAMDVNITHTDMSIKAEKLNLPEDEYDYVEEGNEEGEAETEAVAAVGEKKESTSEEESSSSSSSSSSSEESEEKKEEAPVAEEKKEEEKEEEEKESSANEEEESDESSSTESSGSDESE